MIRMKRATTTLGHALLGLLHQQPQSGYDLRKVFETTPMGHFSSSPGAIYPALKRLQQRALIEGEIDQTQSLRPREVFRPTAAGSQTFRDWLGRDIVPDDVIWNMDELMLRFAFHSFLESKEATRVFLSDFLRAVEGYVKELRGQLKAMPETAQIHGKLALSSGVEQYQAHCRWARKALRHFGSTES
jgi:DNA-binding PadR family transcriptional regulator